MKNIVKLICSIMVVFFTLVNFGCSRTDSPAPKDSGVPKEVVELNISAAVSLKDALNEIGKKYQDSHPDVKLVYNLGASGSLQKQIEQGAPADIFISAAPKQMNDLEAQNLINKNTRKNLVENKLVIITPKESQLAVSKYEDLVNDNVKKIAIGETGSVPAGQYAQEVLKNLSIWDKIQDKIVFAKDVRTVLAYVETGNVDAGIVYQTDAAISQKVAIRATAPEGSHQPIIYPAAIVSATKQTKAAEDFLTYLFGKEAAQILEKYGYHSLTSQ